MNSIWSKSTLNQYKMAVSNIWLDHYVLTYIQCTFFEESRWLTLTLAASLSFVSWCFSETRGCQLSRDNGAHMRSNFDIAL